MTEKIECSEEHDIVNGYCFTDSDTDDGYCKVCNNKKPNPYLARSEYE